MSHMDIRNATGSAKLLPAVRNSLQTLREEEQTTCYTWIGGAQNDTFKGTVKEHTFFK